VVLVRVLVWPVVVVFSLTLFSCPLSKLINRIQNLEISKDQKGNFKVALITGSIFLAEEAKVPNSSWDAGKLNAVVLLAKRYVVFCFRQ
jgi:hypothetical protein